MASLTEFIVLVAGVGCGLVAGIFLAFSSFVMTALARLPAAQSVAAMQAINVAVINPLFLGLFLGSGVLALLAAVLAPSPYSIAGAVLYLVVTIGVTLTANVPLNNQLAVIDPKTPAAVRAWEQYHARWTRRNHVRTVAALIACVVLLRA